MLETMSADIATRWPVVVPLPVEPGDRDDDGRLTAAGVERLFTRASAEYFALCTTIVASPELRRCAVAPGTVPVGAEVTVSVGVVEIYPESFDMDVRIRPAERDGIAASGRCSLAPVGGVSESMRDEFIALAHAARHMH
jgi:hypothetical protein